MDTDDYIAAMKTMDPLLAQGLGSSFNLEALKPFIPVYRGMRHPPPKTGSPECDKPWSAPFLSNYTAGRGQRLRLTMCNWYLPQGPGVPAIYRSDLIQFGTVPNGSSGGCCLYCCEHQTVENAV